MKSLSLNFLFNHVVRILAQLEIILLESDKLRELSEEMRNRANELDIKNDYSGLDNYKNTSFCQKQKHILLLKRYEVDEIRATGNKYLAESRILYSQAMHSQSEILELWASSILSTYGNTAYKWTIDGCKYRCKLNNKNHKSFMVVVK